MLKSPEQYLSEIDFNLDDDSSSRTRISSGERAFIEKYLGQDALNQLKQLDPVPHFVPVQPQKPAPVKYQEPRLNISQKTIEVVPDRIKEPPRGTPVTPVTTDLPKVGKKDTTLVRTAVKEEPKQEIKVVTEPKPARIEAPVEENAKAEAQVEPVQKDIASTAVEAKPIAPQTTEVHKAPDESVAVVDTPEIPVAENISTEETVIVAAPPTAVASAPSVVAVPVPVPLKERLKQENEIQFVSFFVSGQLFLLPVAAIQEVLRHMELVKVPQAPDFVAGVINLRGTVTPLVYLSSLLTNNNSPVYSEKNFIIICGDDTLQLGLIIDKISSMHVLPQDRIIWNAESKLGDSAEFLMAIADLDGKVCGIVAPDVIAQKILGAE